MPFKDLLVISKGTRNLIVVMVVLSLIGIAGAFLYFRAVNRTEDPRIVQAKRYYKAYTEQMKKTNYDQALSLLDNMERVYLKVPGYKDSYEIGVININRASVYLIKVETQRLAESKEIIEENVKVYLEIARDYIDKGIEVYKKWELSVKGLSENDVYNMIIQYFNKDDDSFSGYNLDKILERRVDDIIEARFENHRRLSVAYTNLGVIDRYQGFPHSAKANYQKALNLWEDNFTAKNNLNVLHGLPVQKRSMKDQLFPKKRKVEEEK